MVNQATKSVTREQLSNQTDCLHVTAVCKELMLMLIPPVILEHDVLYHALGFMYNVRSMYRNLRNRFTLENKLTSKF